MEITGYVIYGIGVILAIIWLIGIRIYTKRGQGVAMSTVNITLLFIVSLITVPILKVSPLHLLWMYPASVVLGMLSLAFPFSLLSIPGNVVARIACIGLNHKEAQRNKERIHRGMELVLKDGLTVEEAKKRLKEEGSLKYRKIVDMIGLQIHRQITNTSKARNEIFDDPQQVLYFSGYINSLIFTALHERGCSDMGVVERHIKYACDLIMPDRLWALFQKGDKSASHNKQEAYKSGVNDGIVDYGKIENGVPLSNLFKYLTKDVAHSKPDISYIRSHENNRELETILLPDVGGFQDLDVIDVLVSIGDIVAVDDSLITIESDKATMDIPSPIAGVVEDIHVNVGDKISEGLPICSVSSANRKIHKE